MTQPQVIGRAFAPERPLLILDAFCCIGGATEGYRRAFPGCHITGVDIQAQPDYRGDAFHQGDAVEFIRGHCFDFIHASCPCQGEGAPTKGTNRARNAAIGRTYPRLITPTRAAHLRLREALPPAYTEWIGRAYVATLASKLGVAA